MTVWHGETTRVRVPCFDTFRRRRNGKACGTPWASGMLCPVAFGVREQSMAPTCAPLAELVNASHQLFVGSFVSGDRGRIAKAEAETWTP